MKSHSSTLFALVGAWLLALSGCASTDGPKNKQQALVCPQCKRVEFRTGPPHYTDSKDACPRCQGAMETLLKEGRLEHKCSICKQSPFTCPVLHPW